MRIAVLWFVLGGSMASASPMVHQGRLLDVSGEPVNGLQTVVVNLIEADGDVPFTESHQVVFENGYYAVRVGSMSTLNPSIFDEPLDVQLTIGGIEMGREPLSSVPSALSVDGYVRVSGTNTVCEATSAGALSYANGRLRFCDGSGWLSLTGSRAIRPMTLLVNDNLDDEEGNFTFSSTSALRFVTEANEGTHSLTAAVFGSQGTGTPDWAAESQPDDQWSLDDSLEDWELVWDYRHVNDNGYERILFANNTAFADNHNGWCNGGSPSRSLTGGWLVAMYWTAGELCFHGTGQSVRFSYVGYHSDWKTLRLVKRNDQLEFYVDGNLQGSQPMPAIGTVQDSVLYLSGSTNGSVSSYAPSQQLTERSQMDNIRFRAR